MIFTNSRIAALCLLLGLASCGIREYSRDQVKVVTIQYDDHGDSTVIERYIEDSIGPGRRQINLLWSVEHLGIPDKYPFLWPDGKNSKPLERYSFKQYGEHGPRSEVISAPIEMLSTPPPVEYPFVDVLYDSSLYIEKYRYQYFLWDERPFRRLLFDSENRLVSIAESEFELVFNYEGQNIREILLRKGGAKMARLLIFG
jgi:hypothetical protein